MAGYNYAQNIIGLKKGASDIHELEVEVANLSASVLSIAGDVENLEDKIITSDYSVVITTGIGGKIKEFTVSTLPQNYKIISADIIYTDDYYRYTAAKGNFGTCIGNRTIIIRLETGDISDTVERTLQFRITAIKTN